MFNVKVCKSIIASENGVLRFLHFIFSGKEEQIIIPTDNTKEDEEEADSEDKEVQVQTTSNLVVEKSDEDQKTSVAVYHGVDGNPLETKLVEGITQFQVK